VCPNSVWERESANLCFADLTPAAAGSAKQSFADGRSQTEFRNEKIEKNPRHLTLRRVVSLFLLACCLLPACQQRMAEQPSYREDEPSSFYSDARASRPLVPGTVARGHLRADPHLFSGSRVPASQNWAFPAALVGAAGQEALGGLAATAAQEGNHVDTFPFPVTREVLLQGQHRYMIYCVVCHDPLGTGHGKIVERGYTQPPSYHIERLRRAPVGRFFDVMTNGYGSMPEYKQQIPPRDRWAIAAFIRALQLSQHFPAAELTADMRREWDEQTRAARAGGRP
jgi:mono/diheme cytochrome c family protein